MNRLFTKRVLVQEVELLGNLNSCFTHTIVFEKIGILNSYALYVLILICKYQFFKFIF